MYSGAIHRVVGNPTLGETVLLKDFLGQPLALGAYSPQSNIRIRIWTWNLDESIDREFFQRRLQEAVSLRQTLYNLRIADEVETDAMRLVHAESDNLPGLVVDRYGDTLVVQYLTAGVELWREILTDILMEITQVERIYERSDVDVRELEGLPKRAGLLRGSAPPERVLIHEGKLSFWVDITKGHKTGFYLDQRPNRFKIAQMARDREVLDCFTYTGGFALSSLTGGAKAVTALEVSADAVALAKANLAINRLSTDRVEWIEGDVFQTLRKFRDQAREFDLIILDPPKFAHTTAQVERASRGYKDINLLALKLLRPGGLLATFSCSGGVSEDLFQKIIFGAALDAGVEAKIIERLHQGFDHPVALNFPEGAYLKGFILSVSKS